jgi:hypothetical protein
MNYHKRFVTCKDGVTYRVKEQRDENLVVEVCTDGFKTINSEEVDHIATKEEKKQWDLSKRMINSI